jgi:REP element-mobilizing transposase RayT
MHRAPTVEQFGKPTLNTIPTIIRGYKSSVTKQINILRNQPGVPVWQRNYYEHIIRDEKSCYQIWEYVQTNPLKWQDDKYYV